MRPALSFWFMLALAAALTLSMKARLNDYSAEPDESHLMRDLTAKLVPQQFITTVETHHFPESTVIATRGSCIVRITDGSRANQMAPILTLQSRSVGPLKYFYKGQWSVEPPILSSEFERYFQLVATRLGVRRSREVILAVASSPGCKHAAFDLSGASIQMTS